MKHGQSRNQVGFVVHPSRFFSMTKAECLRDVERADTWRCFFLHLYLSCKSSQKLNVLFCGDLFVSSFHFVQTWLQSRSWPGFFVNNQFRIIVDQSAAGSDNLENIFQENLRRIGQIVAVLDTWQEPIYLQRVWTIYEQFVACSMNIPVVFVMPQEATSSLSQRLSLGDDGISEVTRSLCNVNVSQAEAFDPRDEKKVKDTIQNTVGFERVNQHVKSAMVQWIGAVVREKFQRLVNEAEEDTFHV